MPIWINVLVVLAMGLLVVWGMRGLARSIDHSMAAKGEEEASSSGDTPGKEDKSDE